MGRCHWPAVFNGEAKGHLCFHEDTRLIVLTCWKHFMDLFIRAVILTCEPFISFWICLYWLEFFFRESSSVFSELKFSCSLLCSFWIREIVSRSSYGKYHTLSEFLLTINTSILVLVWFCKPILWSAY